MEILAGSLAHLSPVARLSGGYGFVSSVRGGALRSVRDIRPEDRFNVRLKDGVIEAVAETVTETESLFQNINAAVLSEEMVTGYH